MRQKRAVNRLAVILPALVVAYLGLCWVLANNYLHPERRIPVRPAEFEEIELPTRYGPTPAWITPSLVRNQSRKPIFLLAHGYGGARDSWTELMRGLNERGFDCVALAMPGQDASPAPRVGFGILESHVIVDAEKELRATHPGRKVVVLGVSMGGAAAWLATQEDPSIAGIVSDCAFARFDEAMNAFFNRKLPGGSVILSPVVWIAGSLAKVDPSSIKPVDAAAQWRGKPALVIQGDADTLVVPSHAIRLSKAAGCPVWMVPGAGHAEAFQTDPARYLEHLVNFADSLK